MSTIATIHVLCEGNPSLGSTVVNGLLAWATVLGGFTAFGSGLMAALLALDSTRAELRADLINRGLGVGFAIGMALGFLMFVLFAANLIS
jgi:hypothetical protein